MGVLDSFLDEIYSKASARGEKLEHLSKKKRQEIRGVDLYKCQSCSYVGAPWNVDYWVVDLDTIKSDIIKNGCKCGGVVILVDD